MRRNAAFTLVELLVVLAIIAVMISLLLPAANRARAAAKSVVCLSNLRQVGLGIATYAVDSYGYTPPCANMAAGVPWGNSYGSGWVSRLAGRKYVMTTLSSNLSKRDVFACPLDTQTQVIQTTTVPYYSSYKGLSYYWTANLPGAPTGETMFNNTTPLKLTKLRAPAMELMPWHNGQVYKDGNPPSRFPLIIEEHSNEGMTQDPWGFPYATMRAYVPHGKGERAALMNDLSVERMEIGFAHPKAKAPVAFYFLYNGF